MVENPKTKKRGSEKKMKLMAIGRVLDPEPKVTSKGRSYVEFGLLVGKSSELINSWDGDSCFEFARSLKDGDQVIAILTPSLYGNFLRYSLSDLVFAPEGYRESVNSLFVRKPAPAPAPAVDLLHQFPGLAAFLTQQAPASAPAETPKAPASAPAETQQAPASALAETPKTPASGQTGMKK